MEEIALLRLFLIGVFMRVTRVMVRLNVPNVRQAPLTHPLGRLSHVRTAKLVNGVVRERHHVVGVPTRTLEGSGFLMAPPLLVVHLPCAPTESMASTGPVMGELLRRGVSRPIVLTSKEILITLVMEILLTPVVMRVVRVTAQVPVRNVAPVTTTASLADKRPVPHVPLVSGVVLERLRVVHVRILRSDSTGLPREPVPQVARTLLVLINQQIRLIPLTVERRTHVPGLVIQGIPKTGPAAFLMPAIPDMEALHVISVSRVLMTVYLVG